METKNEVEVNYPRFIVDKPEGKDLYEGKSQDRIAENITNFISENYNSSRKVIGIEGEWGSGKSNVIEILKNNLIKDYYFYIFDSWGHQEDLTRRSILEGILRKLIKDSVLKGDVTKWNEALKNLLSKKIETTQKNVPKLSMAIIWTILSFLLMPISKFIADSYLRTYTGTISGINYSPSIINYVCAILILISSFSPLIIYLIISFCRAEEGQGIKSASELFYIYKGKEIESTSEETISESEPTVQQFVKFLGNLENNSTKKLVIVFDNMDRLPSAKVKEIWSSIHTFFASDESDLQTWAIVPFDNYHICNIFKEDSNTEQERTDSYIHKTFSIVFHVSPPVLSDWKIFFHSKFKDAFGFLPSEDQHIETIFDYHHLAHPKIKPRDIIFFVNDLVALKKLWKEEIQIKYLALFALKRASIMKNPFDEIVSRKYLASLGSLFEFDENLDTNMSALAFNVPIERSDEILLKRPIEKALLGEGNFNNICSHKSFFNVLNSVFYSSELNIIHTISILDLLPDKVKENNNLGNNWEKLSDAILKIPKFELKYVESIKTLLSRVKIHSTKDRLLKFLFSKAISFDENKQKYYSGRKYYELIAEFESILKEFYPEKQIEEFLLDNNTESEEYFEFISACPDKYSLYKVTCEATKINDSLIGKFNANEISRYSIPLKIVQIKTDLAELKSHINNIIPTISPDLPNYAEKVTNIYDVGKTLAAENKITFTIPENIATNILSVNPNHPRAVDLLLSIISANILNPLPAHTTDAICQSMLGNVNLKAAFIESYHYYFSYSDLIKYNLQFPSVLTKNAIIELTSGSNQLKGTDVPFLVSKYNEIKSTIFDNKIDLCALFIEKINNFYNSAEEISFVVDSLKYIIPLLTDNHSVDCNLIKGIISQSNKFINEIDKDTWVAGFKDYEASPIIKLFTAMEELKIYDSQKLPSIASTAYNEVLIAISKKAIAIPANIEFWNKILSLLSGNFVNTYMNVRDELLTYNHADVSIAELLFFEKGLFQYGKLAEDQKTSDDVLRRILIPLASGNEDYLNLLKRNAENIKNIIAVANDSIVNFKNVFSTKYPASFEDAEVKKFYDPLLIKFNLLSIVEIETKKETKIETEKEK